MVGICDENYVAPPAAVKKVELVQPRPPRAAKQLHEQVPNSLEKTLARQLRVGNNEIERNLIESAYVKNPPDLHAV